jgi:hypothetical protein
MLVYKYYYREYRGVGIRKGGEKQKKKNYGLKKGKSSKTL